MHCTILIDLKLLCGFACSPTKYATKRQKGQLKSKKERRDKK